MRHSSELNETRQIERGLKGELYHIVAEQRRYLRIEQRKRSALVVLSPLGFRDCDDPEAPGEVYVPETGFHFDCATGSPGEVIKAAIAFGREQGEKGMRARLRALLGL